MGPSVFPSRVCNSDKQKNSTGDGHVCDQSENTLMERTDGAIGEMRGSSQVPT
jgi:hypothetical protein